MGNGRLGADVLGLLRRVLGLLDRLAVGMAYLAGAALLVASFYITLDVLGRRFAGVSSAVTDEFGGYALAVGGVWALAFALTTGSHVRIDILLPRFPPRVRGVLNYAAMAAMAFFAAAVAFYSWKLAIESFTTDARAMSILRTPLFVPQTCLALGFTTLAVQATVILLVGLVESLRHRRFAELAVLPAQDVTEGV
ncbi:MAG: TRAP transporter small permease [Candidatus Rokubacteria bacterium]|nr:TRAP transporter small permease [Candidatus Rokubacteria bacterium]